MCSCVPIKNKISTMNTSNCIVHERLENDAEQLANAANEPLAGAPCNSAFDSVFSKPQHPQGPCDGCSVELQTLWRALWFSCWGNCVSEPMGMGQKAWEMGENRSRNTNEEPAMQVAIMSHVTSGHKSHVTSSPMSQDTLQEYLDRLASFRPKTMNGHEPQYQG